MTLVINVDHEKSILLSCNLKDEELKQKEVPDSMHLFDKLYIPGCLNNYHWL